MQYPGIVGVYDYGEALGMFYLVMEHVDGTDLRALPGTGLTSEQALAIVPQLCNALHHAHEQGVVHRDIKPENILVDRRGRVRIADFGLAKLRDTAASRATSSGRVLGTAHYMAPEQIDHPGEVDHRADIFALGVVTYEMLTGTLPIGRPDSATSATSGSMGSGTTTFATSTASPDSFDEPPSDCPMSADEGPYALPDAVIQQMYDVDLAAGE